MKVIELKFFKVFYFCIFENDNINNNSGNNDKNQEQ